MCGPVSASKDLWVEGTYIIQVCSAVDGTTSGWPKLYII